MIINLYGKYQLVYKETTVPKIAMKAISKAQNNQTLLLFKKLQPLQNGDT